MKYDLQGMWQVEYQDKVYEASVPGCNYLDLINNQVIPDPFVDNNEKLVQQISEHNYKYIKKFSVEEEFFQYKCIELVAKGLDTLCSVILNGQKITFCDNAYITYRIDIAKQLQLGDNILEIEFLSPKKYVVAKQNSEPLIKNFMGLTGIQHLRKPAYHFGWDWGPTLILSGITDDIFIEYYNAKIDEIKIVQQHDKDTVMVSSIITTLPKVDTIIILNITNPQGECSEVKGEVKDGKCIIDTVINNALLWYPNGMGEQPLYNFEYTLGVKEYTLDKITQTVGLRTVQLDTREDKYGQDFCFLINGKRMFAKGANWIPSDSFVQRTTADDIDFYIKSAKVANMNMLRVWGGGYYESDCFYDLCDKYGILVWQDFCYACYPYPFYNADIEKSALIEAEQQVKRLRNHASLAVWCGNNEIELMSPLWFYRKKLKAAQKVFFYHKLNEVVDIYDGATPYWPGSPSSGKFLDKVNSDKIGDTHLWQVWHGLRRPEYYKRRASRFISEFGMQSMPTLNCIKKYSAKDINNKSTSMYSHQKCMGGNQKMLYYLLRMYNLPKRFDHLVYLSNLTQARTVEKAVVNWRRDARCNGVLFWQYNDCWPTSSWSAIDYSQNYKALYSYSKKFFAPIKLSIEKEGNKYSLYCINDTGDTVRGKVDICFVTFDGSVLKLVDTDCAFNKNNSKLCSIELNKYVAKQKRKVYVLAKLYNEKGEVIAVERELCVVDKRAKLPKAKVVAESISINNNKLLITLKTNAFARNVCVEIVDMAQQFSDNYFDMDAKGRVTISCDIDKNIDIDTINQKLKIITMSDLERSSNNFCELIKKIGLILYPPNLINAIAQLFN